MRRIHLSLPPNSSPTLPNSPARIPAPISHLSDAFFVKPPSFLLSFLEGLLWQRVSAVEEKGFFPSLLLLFPSSSSSSSSSSQFCDDADDAFGFSRPPGDSTHFWGWKKKDSASSSSPLSLLRAWYIWTQKTERATATAAATAAATCI